jgi:hypothetical protein
MHTRRWILAAWCLAVAADAAGAQTPDIAVRIYDYASVKPDVIGGAQTLVGRMYQNIGVDIQWTGVARDADEGESAVPEVKPNEFVVAILDERMARHSGFANDAVGAAAVSADGKGRFAYVFFDRVRRTATNSAMSVTEILSLVVAHELGHLHLPLGSHSLSGVMRAKWDLKGLRLDSGRFEFTPMQAEAIRQRVRDIR